MKINMWGLVGALLLLLTVNAQAQSRVAGYAGHEWHSDLYNMDKKHNSLTSSLAAFVDTEKLHLQVLNDDGMQSRPAGNIASGLERRMNDVRTPDHLNKINIEDSTMA
jgi:hypothetical protein